MKHIFKQILLILTMAMILVIPAMAADQDITIFYTNDVHTYIDNGLEEEPGLTYSMVAALKKDTPNALLVDAGDHIQGTAYGSMDSGKTMVDLMIAAGYDVATLGNHEFDYGMEGCMATIDRAEYPYISCNFVHENNGTTGDTVLDPYIMFEAAGKQIAFVGITTPESFTSSTPAYFQDDAGNYIYGILGGDEGKELYDAVQSAIDGAKAAGADYVIALGHLGVDESSAPWRSRDVIANTTGLTAFIDGHSHTTMAQELVADQSGKKIPLTQTGSYLNALGQLTISADGTVSTQLLTAEDISDLTPDGDVEAIETAWIQEIDDQLGTVIGYAQVTLDNYDQEGNRLVRSQSTNTGDFAADALYALFDSMGMEVDAAIMNGGGIRNEAITGELTYQSCKEIHTFGNVACLQAVTGQQILDALEWGAKDLSLTEPVENGGFLQVSGMKYTIDPSIPSTVQMDDKGVWIGGPTGEYRVTDVQIKSRETGAYEPLALDKTYYLAGYNYTLRDLGDGFAMFSDAVNVLDYVAEDYMVLADYIKSFPVDKATGLPTITQDSGYADVNGSGRITILDGSTAPSGNSTYLVMPGDCLWNIAYICYGDGSLWPKLFAANQACIQNPNLIYAGQSLNIPKLQ